MAKVDPPGACEVSPRQDIMTAPVLGTAFQSEWLEVPAEGGSITQFPSRSGLSWMAHTWNMGHIQTTAVSLFNCRQNSILRRNRNLISNIFGEGILAAVDQTYTSEA